MWLEFHGIDGIAEREAFTPPRNGKPEEGENDFPTSRSEVQANFSHGKAFLGVPRC